MSKAYVMLCGCANNYVPQTLNCSEGLGKVFTFVYLYVYRCN